MMLEDVVLTGYLQETWRPHVPFMEQCSILKTSSRLIRGHGQRARPRDIGRGLGGPRDRAQGTT